MWPLTAGVGVVSSATGTVSWADASGVAAPEVPNFACKLLIEGRPSASSVAQSKLALTAVAGGYLSSKGVKL